MSNISELLEQIESLQNSVKDGYSRYVTVMFTDLKDSTVYFETQGDLKGRLLVERHNNILFPIIKKHGGTVIKTIGDAIMARFDFPILGVKASIEMQRALKKHNEAAEDKIRVRIGLHTGEAIVEETDVYGDTVNLAARIEAKTEPEEITISKSTLKGISAFKNIKVEPLGEIKYKGKAEAVETYSVLWDSTILQEGVRGDDEWEKKSIFLEMELKGDDVFSYCRYFDKMELKTIQLPTKSKQFFIPFLNKIEFLYSSTLHQNSVVKNFDINSFKEVGEEVYNSVFKESFDKIFDIQDIQYIVIQEDKNFYIFPFELLYMGDSFLGLKYPIFRKLGDYDSKKSDINFGFLEYTKDNDSLQDQEYRNIKNGFNIANFPLFIPQKVEVDNFLDLKKLDKNINSLHIAFHNISTITTDDIKIDNKEISYSLLKKSDSLKNISTVIANSCKTVPILKSITVEDNKFTDILKSKKIYNYLGNFFNVYSEVGIKFSEKFYQYLLKGYSYPDSLFLTRKYLADLYGENSLLWGTYTLFSNGPEKIADNFISRSIVRGKNENRDQKDIKKDVEKKDNIENRIEQSPKNVKNPNMIYILIFLIAVAIVGGVIIVKALDNGVKNSEVVKKKSKKNRKKGKRREKKVIKIVTKDDNKDGKKSAQYGAIVDSDYVKDDKKGVKKDVAIKKKTGPTIAVIYFDNTSKEKELEPLKKGLADMLITDLAEIESIKVVERDKLEAIIKELNLSKTRFIDKSTAVKIGKMLQAKYLMMGSFLHMFGSLRIDVKLVSVETSAIAWTKGVRGPLKNIYNLERKIVRNFLKSSLVKEKKFKVENKKIKYKAIKLYSKALKAYDNENYKKAKKLLEEAIKIEPKFEYAKRYLDDLPDE